VPGLPDPIDDDESPAHDDGWSRDSAVRERHVSALRKLLGMEFPKPKIRDGKGIVYVGGGRYWTMIAVGIRMARRYTDIPIQVWYGGAGEPVKPEELADLGGITYHDTTREMPGLRKYGGWENKTSAILGSGLDLVVYLDADAYLVADPEPIFQATAANRFSWWIDLPWNETTLDYSWSGLSSPAAVPPVQGGQLGVAVSQFWSELVLAHWINQHSDYWFRHQYGDQDSWRLALSATRGRYHCLGAAGWSPPSFVCWLDGPRIVHRCQGKLWDHGAVSFNPGLPEESTVRDLFNRAVLGTGSPSAVFGRIYEKRIWGHEATSGAGSTVHESAPLLEMISTLQTFAAWKSCADLGCGSGYVAGHLPFIKVYGVDCVPAIMGKDARLGTSVEWIGADLDADRHKLPSADVALLKDVLHHWPTALVREWLKWAIVARKWKWLILAQDVHQQTDGEDCILGGYRALNPSMSPLNEFKLKFLGQYLHKAVYLLDCR
jgi:SAM-dependent methyltransferase